MIYRTFMEFLEKRVNTPEVDDILSVGITDSTFPPEGDDNNLFAVTPHFMKTCSAEPQKVLEALLVAYNRWILNNMRAMEASLERCSTANRVIFVEDAMVKDHQASIWKGVNSCMESLAGNLEDLTVQSNYLLNQRVAARKEL